MTRRSPRIVPPATYAPKLSTRVRRLSRQLVGIAAALVDVQWELERAEKAAKRKR